MSFSGHRGKTSLKLLRRIDGPAVLVVDGREIAVACSAGEYEERNRTTVTGSLDGDLSGLEHNAEARLRIADGPEQAVRLIEPDAFGADFRSA